MKDKLLIIGAGGHGRVIADIADRAGSYKSIAFLDDRPPVAPLPHPYLGKCGDAKLYLEDYDVIVAIGNADIRRRIMEELSNLGASFATVVAPEAVVSRDVILGVGTVVMPGAIINTGTRIGAGVIINTAASVDHDCVVGDFCHVSVGAHLCGTVSVEAQTWIGAGATVINNIHICGGCMIGAGAVVVKNVTMVGMYLGVPAKRKNDRKSD